MAKNNNLGDFLTDIANAIRTKKGTSGTIQAQDFSSEILSIPSGGGANTPHLIYDENEPLNWSWAYYIYSQSDKLDIFSNAWQDSQDAKTVLYDIPLTLVAPNQDMGGMTVDLYAGTNSELGKLYNDCLNEVIPTSNNDENHTFISNNWSIRYMGDYSSFVGFPIPIFLFGEFDGDEGAKESFVVADLTPLGMGLGIVLGKWVGNSIPNNKVVIQQGFEFENENGIILPNSVTSIGDSAFFGWETNNQPLVIPESVTSIGDSAFYDWNTNNQPLVIPNSVTSIGNYAFSDWISNNQPLVIPNSVTSIGNSAFYGWTLVPYVEVKAVTPPSLVNSNAFNNQNNAPIYVPDESVNDYKTATNWVNLASRIFPISDK